MILDRSYNYTAPNTGETRHVEDLIDTSDLRHGKYNCPMAVYLDDLAGNGGEDEWTGNGDIGESTIRIGRWLVSYDSQGFIEAYKYDTLDAAKAEFARIDAAFSELQDDDDQ